MDILIDAGPIIAFFNKSDRYHDQITEFFCQFTGQLITTCPVITEALWQLRGNLHHSQVRLAEVVVFQACAFSFIWGARAAK